MNMNILIKIFTYNINDYILYLKIVATIIYFKYFVMLFEMISVIARSAHLIKQYNIKRILTSYYFIIYNNINNHCNYVLY
jgi:hypothetical protein